MENNGKHMSTSSFITFVEQLHQHRLMAATLQRFENHPKINNAILLFALWYAVTEHGKLRKQDILTLRSAIQLWHERIVLPLKHIMALLTDSKQPKVMALKSQLQPEALMAGEIELHLLSETLLRMKQLHRNQSQQLVDACYNMVTYCKVVATTLSDEDQQAIVALLLAALPMRSIGEISAQLHHALAQAQLTNHVGAQMELADF